MSLVAAGFSLCDDIYPPPVGCWLWVGETSLSTDEECWHAICYRDGEDGAAWAYHTVITPRGGSRHSSRNSPTTPLRGRPDHGG